VGGCEIRVDGVDYRPDRPRFVDGPEARAVVRQAFGRVERAMFRVLGIRQYLAAAPRRKLTLRTAPTVTYAAVPGLAGQG
jgi:hypothetical protein